MEVLKFNIVTQYFHLRQSLILHLKLHFDQLKKIKMSFLNYGLLANVQHMKQIMHCIRKSIIGKEKKFTYVYISLHWKSLQKNKITFNVCKLRNKIRIANFLFHTG